MLCVNVFLGKSTSDARFTQKTSNQNIVKQKRNIRRVEGINERLALNSAQNSAVLWKKHTLRTLTHTHLLLKRWCVSTCVCIQTKAHQRAFSLLTFASIQWKACLLCVCCLNVYNFVYSREERLSDTYTWNIYYIEISDIRKNFRKRFI